MKLKLSIVLPCFNDRNFITKCIESLKNQGLGRKNYEIIVVDDESTDGSRELLKKASGIRLLLPRHLGRSNARNFGLKNSRGEIVFFAESDAVYSRNFLEESLKPFKNPSVGGSIGKLEALNTESPWVKCRAADYDSRFENDYKPFTGWMYRKKIIQELKGFDSSLDIGEDVDLGQRVLKKGWKIEYSRKAVWRHFEPDTLQKVLKRFWERGKGMAKYYKKNGFPKKILLLDLIAFASIPFALFFPPLIVIFIAFSVIQVFMRRRYFSFMKPKYWLHLLVFLFSTMIASKLGRFYGILKEAL